MKASFPFQETLGSMARPTPRWSAVGSDPIIDHLNFRLDALENTRRSPGQRSIAFVAHDPGDRSTELLLSDNNWRDAGACNALTPLHEHAQRQGWHSQLINLRQDSQQSIHDVLARCVCLCVGASTNKAEHDWIAAANQRNLAVVAVLDLPGELHLATLLLTGCNPGGPMATHKLLPVLPELTAHLYLVPDDATAELANELFAGVERVPR